MFPLCAIYRFGENSTLGTYEWSTSTRAFSRISQSWTTDGVCSVVMAMAQLSSVIISFQHFHLKENVLFWLVWSGRKSGETWCHLGPIKSLWLETTVNQMWSNHTQTISLKCPCNYWILPPFYVKAWFLSVKCIRHSVSSRNPTMEWRGSVQQACAAFSEQSHNEMRLSVWMEKKWKKTQNDDQRPTRDLWGEEAGKTGEASCMWWCTSVQKAVSPTAVEDVASEIPLNTFVVLIQID